MNETTSQNRQVLLSNENHGTICFHLAELLQKKGISKNKFCYAVELSHSQLNRYCSSSFQRIDMAILARFCAVLGCQVSDLIEYIPPQERKK